MVIFNSYVKLPEGTTIFPKPSHFCSASSLAEAVPKLQRAPMELPTPKKVGISMGSLGPKDLPMLFFSTSRFVYLEEFMGKALGNPVIYIYIYIVIKHCRYLVSNYAYLS